ncbi:hypothetical protein CH352_08810 [Leptospira hartskeerlii]|uniref:Uncharacterized protein n=1 Tax=Leptospira hartskeerlii TaxID=2023177 RepID=A0A2M9XHQ8_9LEPT|nr:hypothetical protein CH357_01075 [Leptospira hartskeerlii]PJZ33843.1 hypothetical protein CH352_08810 [Leptospira hartskeerlii]
MKVENVKEWIPLENAQLRDAYTQGDFTSVPGKTLLRLRTCVLWQIWRFFWINVRMTLMILKSHH